MQIVIEMPVEEYDRVKRGGGWTNLSYYLECIKDGIVLPYPHGRLIDADRMDLHGELFTFTRYTGIDEAPLEDATGIIDKAPTVLPAYPF